MKKFFKVFLYFFAIVVLIFAANTALNITLYNPAVAIPAFAWAENHGLVGIYNSLSGILSLGRNDYSYPIISASRLQNNLFFEPRAAVVGTVMDVAKSTDGDWHLNVQDINGKILVAEMVPEYPLPLPKIGEKIKIRGITRYDLDHRWWELHPVFGWEAEK